MKTITKKQALMNTRRKAKDIWTRTIGEIPEGCDIHHLDHDPFNNDILNLVCWTRDFHRDYHFNSPVTKAKQSAAAMGKSKTDETRAKMSASKKGKARTQQDKDRIGEGVRAYWARRKEAAKIKI